MEPKTIVISAVNLNRGGTLRILRDCLSFLSELAAAGEFRVVAVVYSKALVDFPHIEYIETQWPKKLWLNRLWFEYVSLRKISKTLQPVALWFSLHDTSPSVYAEKRAVYCHNSFPFLKWKLRDLFFAPKIVLFALFSRFFYQVNIHRNDYLVVQQQWFRAAFVRLFNLQPNKIVVAPPVQEIIARPLTTTVDPHSFYTFIYPAISDSHKNFECICEAVKLLWQEGIQNFRVVLTIKGDENAYTRWLYSKWGTALPPLEFRGYADRLTLIRYFEEVDCLLFPSKVETWGLPISEFSFFQKPMLLADLPYAHETAQGNEQIAFFSPEDPSQLAAQMRSLIKGDQSFLKAIPRKEIAEPVVHNWKELFALLLNT
ncbi:glycosyltransferase [Sphingobacterium sp. LRF_L2]|uniref:glycosyltransferase n=1 Tax=Sphingobacterium sp. LRF_L2 TaxID=3369421 RepID=UPI003F626401